MTYTGIETTIHFNDDTVDELWLYDGENFNDLISNIQNDLTAENIAYATIEISDDAELVIYPSEVQIVNTSTSKTVFAF